MLIFTGKVELLKVPVFENGGPKLAYCNVNMNINSKNADFPMCFLIHIMVSLLFTLQYTSFGPPVSQICCFWGPSWRPSRGPPGTSLRLGVGHLLGNLPGDPILGCLGPPGTSLRPGVGHFPGSAPIAVRESIHES
jgi:hypothetical protein